MSTSAPGIFSAGLPDLYERFLVGPLFRPFAEALVERLAPSAGEGVLDVACGTGIVARLARERVGTSGRVVGVDASAPMLEVAAKTDPAVEWRQGTAAALPVSDEERFDVVFCHQGLQFFPDKPVAVREMRRVANAGGRLAVATWRPLADTPVFRDLHEIAERHLGPLVDQRHSFGDADAIRSLVVEAGLQDVRLETISRRIRVPELPVFARLNTMAMVGMSPAAKTMTEEQRGQAVAAIVNETEDLFQRCYTDDSGCGFELGSNLVTARARA